MTWLAGLPPRYVLEDPWMLLWRAGRQIAVNSPACRDDCDKAITLFRTRRDAAGAYLAWSTATFSIAYESISADLFDPWLALFDTLRREFPEFPSEEIEARVANSMLLAVTWRRPQHPDAESWAERAFELSRGKSDVNARAQTLFVWVMHHIQSGNFRSAVAAVPEAWQLATAREGPPLTAVIARVAIAWTWLAGEKDSRRAATEGFALAKSAAVANGDCECLLNLAAMALHDGDADTASGRLREVEKRLGQSGQAYRLWYHSYVTWEALVRNDPLKAASAARSTLQFMQTGRPWDEAVGLTLATLALHESGAKEEARQQLSHLLALAERMRSPFVEFMARLFWVQVRANALRGYNNQRLWYVEPGLACSREWHQAPDADPGGWVPPGACRNPRRGHRCDRGKELRPKVKLRRLPGKRSPRRPSQAGAAGRAVHQTCNRNHVHAGGPVPA